MSVYTIETVLTSRTATKAFSFCHITDSHLALPNETDDERKRKNAAERTGCFETPSGLCITTCFEEQLEHTKKTSDFALFTGDILDFPGQSNFDTFQKNTAGVPFLYIYGNHDWNYAWEQENKALLPARTALFEKNGILKPDMRADEINGVIFIGLSNTDYQFTEEACAFTEAYLKKGKDVILYFHIPLYAKTLCSDVMHYWGKSIVVGMDEARLQREGAEPTAVKATAATTRMLDLLETYQDHVLAVIAGHIHFSHEDKTPFGFMQYVTEAGCYGTLRRFSILPEKGCE